jgi:hypothetical protein
VEVKPQTWNDVLALVFGLTILGFWVTTGCGLVDLPDIILGATISAFTLIIQYYFRKAKSEK